MDNSSFVRVEQFNYLDTTLMNQNSIQEEIKSRLKSRNACYHSMQNLLSYSLLSKTIKIKIYTNIILPVVWCGCETWSLTSREEHRLRVFENRVLKMTFGPKEDEVTGGGGNYLMRSFTICSPHQLSFRLSNPEECGGWGK